MARVLAVEISKCTGCEACVLACSFQNTGVFSVVKARIQVTKFKDKGINVPLFCQQCGNAPCLTVCPSRALQRDRVLGTVYVDRSRCIGCRMCSQVCPFGAISYDEESGIAFKCELCEGSPKCVEVCTPGALRYVEAGRPGVVRLQDAALRCMEAERLAKEG